MERAWLIYNPAAGRFPARLLVERAAQVLKRSGWSIRLVETQGVHDLKALSARAAGEGCEAVFVAGGDGSVGQVAEGLAGSETALGVLPSGTANVWAKEMGLERLSWAHWFALEEAAGRLAAGRTRLVDLGEANGRSFLLWAGVGLDGRIVNSVEPRERWEKAFASASYMIQGIWNSIGWEGTRVRVEALGQSWEDRFVVAVASNIRAYAGGMIELAPSAKIDDGLLDFWLIGGRSMKDAIVRLAQVLMGVHVDAPGVTHFLASEATFHAQEALPMQFDGEPAVFSPPIRFRVRPRALKVIVPQGGWPPLFVSGQAAGQAPGRDAEPGDEG